MSIASVDRARLRAARERLQSSADPKLLLQALEEIVTTLVGCREMVIHEVSRDHSLLTPVKVVGLRPDAVGPIRVGDGVLGLAAATGRVWVGDAGQHELAGRGVSACIPLLSEGRVTGVLVLYRLVEGKARLQGSDLELLETIGRHAGTGLGTTTS